MRTERTAPKSATKSEIQLERRLDGAAHRVPDKGGVREHVDKGGDAIIIAAGPRRPRAETKNDVLGRAVVLGVQIDEGRAVISVAHRRAITDDREVVRLDLDRLSVWRHSEIILDRVRRIEDVVGVVLALSRANYDGAVGVGGLTAAGRKTGIIDVVDLRERRDMDHGNVSTVKLLVRWMMLGAVRVRDVENNPVRRDVPTRQMVATDGRARSTSRYPTKYHPSRQGSSSRRRGCARDL